MSEIVRRPPHWSRDQWIFLCDLVSPDRLCHGMWMVLDDPIQVLDWHHRGDGAPPWASLIEGEWPNGWNDRARNVGTIARARHLAARHPRRAETIMRRTPSRPAHWPMPAWGRLEAEVAPDLLWDAVWLLTTDPSMVLADLRSRPEPPAVARQNGATDPNSWCWLAGTGQPREPLTSILTLARAHGGAGITRADAEQALASAGHPHGRETASGHLRRLVSSGQLVHAPRAAGGRGGADLYVIPDPD